MVSSLQWAALTDTRTQPRCVHMQEIDTLEKRDWAAKLMAIAVAVFMVSSTFVLFAPEASARTGSDDYGYTFKDSAESGGPAYSWIEVQEPTLSVAVLMVAKDYMIYLFPLITTRTRILRGVMVAIMATSHLVQSYRICGPRITSQRPSWVARLLRVDGLTVVSVEPATRTPVCTMNTKVPRLTKR